jgi:hypothetical protein
MTDNAARETQTTDREMQTTDREMQTHISRIEIARVERSGRPPLIRAYSTVTASLEHCWQTLTDFPAYRDWMPRVARCAVDTRASAISGHDSDEVALRAVIALPGPLTDLQVDSRVSFERSGRVRTIRWREDGGDLARNRGELRLERLDADLTRVTYTVDIAPARSLPLFIWSRAVSWALPAVLRAFRRRLEQSALPQRRSAFSTT